MVNHILEVFHIFLKCLYTEVNQLRGGEIYDLDR